MNIFFAARIIICTFAVAIACLYIPPTPAYGLEVELTQNGTVTLHAEGAPLRRILHRLTQQGIGVRIDPDISLNVTAAYEKAEIRNVFDVILGDYNYALIWDRCTHCPENEFALAEIQIFKPGEKDRLQPLPAGNPFDIVRDPKTGDLYVRNEVLVRLLSESGQDALETLVGKIGAVIADHSSGLYRIILPDGIPVPAFLEMLKNEQIAEAEPNFAYRLSRPYAMIDPGVKPPGIYPDTSLGKNPPVAVFDSGLSPEFSRAPYVLDTFNAMDPEAPVYDTQGHGTQMTMIASGAVSPIGQDGRNMETVPVLSIQGFDENGFTSNYTLMRGIDYALEKGARVLSLSWHSTTQSAFLNQYLEQAGENGLFIVAAAGNEPTGAPVYPAAGAGVIGVGALSPDGSRWSESNYGNFVSFEAPGFAKLPTGYNGPAGIYAGTSIATAYTARLISGYLAGNPDGSKEDVNAFLRKQQAGAGN